MIPWQRVDQYERVRNARQLLETKARQMRESLEDLIRMPAQDRDAASLTWVMQKLMRDLPKVETQATYSDEQLLILEGETCIICGNYAPVLWVLQHGCAVRQCAITLCEDCILALAEQVRATKVTP